ncbi:MAG: dihydroorotate dehydrogenase [Deltaproteobacteria bacterium]|nr:dihydroorotate dehydrogenase [Deltaproteobacteria bacterium]
MKSERLRIGTLKLRNPVLTASGTCGYGLELARYFDIAVLGAICTKGLSLEPRMGNPPPRTCETPAGMLNSIGLANVGVEAFVRDKLPELRAAGATVMANVLGTSPDEFARIAARLDAVEGVHALELNLSCPNVKEGGLKIGTDPGGVREAVAAARGATKRPIVVKLSPETADVCSLARAAADAGADAVSVMNTIRGMSIDIRTRRPRLGNILGGLSGPAIRPIAVRLVFEVSRAVSIPVIGIGGIMRWEDAVEMMLAGATAVQVGTASFVNPRAALDVLQGLEAWRRAQKCGYDDVIGAVRIE